MLQSMDVCQVYDSTDNLHHNTWTFTPLYMTVQVGHVHAGTMLCVNGLLVYSQEHYVRVSSTLRQAGCDLGCHRTCTSTTLCMYD